MVGLDYLSAIAACCKNLKENPNLHVVQAKIYEAPFAPNSFEYVYSLGVLQHIPDVKNAFSDLPPLVVKREGLSEDLFAKSVRNLFVLRLGSFPSRKRLIKMFYLKL